MTTLSPLLPAVESVSLRVRDLPRVSAFYSQVLGLTPLREGAGRVTLGAYGQPLLTLEAAPTLPPAPTSRPGLYHTAFLLPTRADLGRWVGHASALNLRVGSGDHLVSEAFYLSDPEGNGVEVYADRPRDTWTWDGGQVRMDTLPVDVLAVYAAGGDTPYAGAPAGTAVGHVHLKVGNAAAAAQFYSGALGLDAVSHVPGAAFLSWGGYHHHVGLNEWHSAGQGAQETPALGLGGVTFVVPDLEPLRARLHGRAGTQDHGDAVSLADPWGNALTVRAAP